MDYDKAFEYVQSTLDEIIEETVNKRIRPILHILENPKTSIHYELIERIEEGFKEKVRRRIPIEYYKIICGEEKLNRRFQYNPIKLLSEVKKRVMRFEGLPTFKNVIKKPLDDILNSLNNPYDEVNYPYLIALLYPSTRKSYKIPLIDIPEAYFYLIVNRNSPFKKEPPIGIGRYGNIGYINEFDIEIPSFPKRLGYDRVIIKGYRNLGDFEVIGTSNFDTYEGLRKIADKKEEVEKEDEVEYYYSIVIGRQGYQALLTMNLLETIRFGYPRFSIIVPAPELITIFQNIFYSQLLRDPTKEEIKIPQIFTYLALTAEILKRREEGLNSFYRSNGITKEKLENLYERLRPRIDQIINLRGRYITMKSAAS